MNDCYFEKKDWRICRQEVGAVVDHFSTALELLLLNRDPTKSRAQLRTLSSVADGDILRWKPFENVGRGRATIRERRRKMYEVGGLCVALRRCTHLRKNFSTHIRVLQQTHRLHVVCTFH